MAQQCSAIASFWVERPMKRSGLSVLLCATAVCLLSSRTTHAQTSASPPRERDISHLPACTTCTIDLIPLATLRPQTDSFWFGANVRVVRLPDGGYMVLGVSGSESPQLYNGRGEYLRRLMPRGIGPGENVGAQLPAVVTASDTVHFYSSGGTGRGVRHVFGPDMNWVRTDNMPLSPTSAAVIGPGNRTVIATDARSPGRAGLPLHLLTPAGDVIRSFGRDDASFPPGASAGELRDLMFRLLTNGGDGTYWSYNDVVPVLERWNFEGELVQRLRFGGDGWYRAAAQELNSSPTARPVRMAHALLEGSGGIM